MASYWYDDFRGEFSVGDFLLSDRGDELLGVVVAREPGGLDPDPVVYRPDVGRVTSMAELVRDLDLSVVAVRPPAEDRRDEILAAIERLRFGEDPADGISLEDAGPSLHHVRTTCQEHPGVRVPPPCKLRHREY